MVSNGTTQPVAEGQPAVAAESPVFHDLAREVFERHGRVWKPGTLAVNRSYLKNQILPFFHDRPVGDIAREEVVRWFASLRATPAAANRSLPVLSVIMREAERYGHRPSGSNPCRGVRRYRQGGRERFLTFDEVRCLAAALDATAVRFPVAVALVRMLLLTGCRQGEMRSLRWREYREGHLYLEDGKSGPRTVWLSSAARELLDRLPRKGTWVFPGPKSSEPMSCETLYRSWRVVRSKAELCDVRLHDLRHSYASLALGSGETVPVIGRLLGHRNPATTLRYVHYAEGAVRQAVEAVGAAVSEE